MPSKPSPPPSPPSGIHILWSDEYILAVNKPAGLLVIPDGYDPGKPCLVRLLEVEAGRVWTVHRLDRETSGVVVFARSAKAHRRLNAAFEHRQIRKTYHALVVGQPEWKTLTIDRPLRVDGDRHHRTTIDPQRGKPAVTEVSVLECWGSTCLVAAHPLSGYTHQIRAHLASTGFPLLGDPLYGGKTTTGLETGSPPCLSRLALHACRIDLAHPITRQPLQLEAVYPDDFSRAVEAFRMRTG